MLNPPLLLQGRVKRSTYLPMTSVSIFTSSPIFRPDRVVARCVSGMMLTENPPSETLLTVRLMPLMATEPLLIR